MKRHSKGVFYGVALAGASALLAGGACFAQTTQEVTIQATRVNTEVVGRSSSGVPTKEVSLSTVVNAAGLDISTYSGATAFETRVRDAALAACKEIGKKYPDATPSETECARSAADKALKQVHMLVAAAESSAKNR